MPLDPHDASHLDCLLSTTAAGRIPTKHEPLDEARVHLFAQQLQLELFELERRFAHLQTSNSLHNALGR